MSRPEEREPEAVAASLGVDPASGLGEAEIERRRAVHGPNTVEAEKRAGVVASIVESATEPFILLLAGAGILAVLLGEVRDGLLILAALIPIVGADVVTEIRAERALDALRAASAPTALTRRDGRVAEIPSADLVPGDIVLLGPGDVVAADLRLTRCDGLVVNRSALTGESVPEAARVAADPAGTPLPDRRAMAFGGTSVVAGRAEGIVVATGPQTEVGRIATGLGGGDRQRSPLQRELDRLVRIALVVAGVIIGIIVVLGFARGQELGATLLAGISAAIAAIPEEPPILLAVVLGLGAYRLLKKGVLVRRLNAQEVLGAVDLVVTDKTGTITENRLEIASLMMLAGDPAAAGQAGEVRDPAERQAILVEALRSQDDAWARAEGATVGSFSAALIRAIEALGGDARTDPSELLVATPVADGRPFTSTRARRGAIVEELALGAPEAILSLAAGVGVSEAEAWTDLVGRCTARGERVLLLARRQDDGPWAIRAIVAFADPIRAGIADAFAEVLGAGIQIVIVTGDHPATAAAIARDAGLDGSRVVLGDDLDSWDDERIVAELPGLTVVARSTPAQKDRIVAAARRAGRIVAVTGDGVNDAPALTRADVGVAMGSGTAVAREAADLVLGDDSFLTLTEALREGRRMVDNVRKGLVFLISTHIALLGFVLIATLVGFGQPLLPIQILWLELFIDISASVAFERERGEADLMRRPPRHATDALLPLTLLGRIGAAGGVSAVAALVLFVWALAPAGGSLTGTDGAPLDHARWLAFTALVCGQVVRAYANRSLHVPLHRMGANGFLLLAAFVVVVVQVLIPYVPPLADAFRAVPLDAGEWLLVAVVALAPAVVAEVVRTVRPRTWVA